MQEERTRVTKQLVIGNEIKRSQEEDKEEKQFLENAAHLKKAKENSKSTYQR